MNRDRSRRNALVAVLVVTTLAASACSSKKSDEAKGIDTTAGRSPETSPVTSAINPNPSGSIAPASTPAPTTTIRMGAPDDDAAAAAPNTTPFATITVLPPPSPAVAPSTLPLQTVPDLGIDASKAEAMLTAAVLPEGWKPIGSESAAVRGNAAAYALAPTPVMQAAVRSASSKLLQHTDGRIQGVWLLMLDPAFGAEAVQRELSSKGGQVTQFGGRPAVESSAGVLTLVSVIDGARVVTVAKNAESQAFVDAVLAIPAG